MSRKTKSAAWCHPVCQWGFGVALHESHSLYGFLGASAYGAIYLIKLFNRYITALVGHGVMGATGANNLTKLRNLVAQVALSAPWLWI